jgi:hypothetical protein
VKVIFIEDVPNIARAGQTKEVADGYARNFLFPRKLAFLANSQAAAAVEAHLKKIVKQRTLEEAEEQDDLGQFEREEHEEGGYGRARAPKEHVRVEDGEREQDEPEVVQRVGALPLGQEHVQAEPDPE